MANPITQMLSSKAPALMAAPVAYIQQYTNQVMDSLRLYFVQIDNITRVLLGPQGGRFIDNPYGSFYSLVDQTAASTTVAYPMAYEVTDLSSGVSVVTSGGVASRITVANAGVYNIQFSTQFKNSSATQYDAEVWLRKNGTNVSNSNTLIGISSKHGSVDGHVVAAWNFVNSLAANDYVEIVWCTPNLSVGIATYSAGASPTRPAVPSVILTVSFVSAA